MPRLRTAAEIALRAGKAYGEDHCTVFAGGVTYFALLSLFPLTLFAISVTGYFFQDAGDQERLVDSMLDLLPLDENSRGDLEKVIASVVDARGTLGVVGLLGAAYSASALFGAVRVSLNAVAHADRKRPAVLGKAVDLGLVLVFTVLLLLSLGVTVGIALAQRFSDELFGAEAATWTARLLTLAYAFVPTAVSAAVFFLLFTLVPAKRLGARHTFWGACVSAVLFEALKVGFTQYVANFGNYNATYGAIGFVIILLVFFNFSAQIMLLGAEVARASAEQSADEAPFRVTSALLEKARTVVRKVPVIGARLAVPAAATASPLPEAGVAVASPPTVAALAEGDAHEPPADLQRARPSALAGLALVAGLVLTALMARRRR